MRLPTILLLPALCSSGHAINDKGPVAESSSCRGCTQSFSTQRSVSTRGGNTWMEPLATRRSSILQMFGPKGNRSSTTAEEDKKNSRKEKATPKPKKKKENKPEKEEEYKPFPRRGLFRAKRNATETTAAKKNPKKKDQTDEAPGKGNQSDSKEPKKEGNATATTSPEGSPNVIVVGGSPTSSSPTAYRVLRTSSSPGMAARPGMIGGSDKSVLVAEALVRVGMRLWILTWLRRQFYGNEVVKPVQRFVWERLNDRYIRDAAVLRSVLDDPPAGIAHWRWNLMHNWKVLQKHQVESLPLQATFNRTVVVVPLGSDKTGNVDQTFLTDVVSFLLGQFRSRVFGVKKPDGEPLPLEVVLLVTSPGGAVSHYGLVAAQVQRLAQEEGITVTACVDKAAASGGYMIASQAHRLIAAPFASLGSVGVILEGLNFRELARQYGVHPIVLKSGKYKNSISTFGAVTAAEERHENERLAQVHKAFQDLVIASRPALANKKDVLEGQVYLGSEALEQKLVDDVMTSDEYILQRVQSGDRVLKLHKSNPSRNRLPLHNLSPLDLLPHIRSWISDRVSSMGPENVTSLLLYVGAALGVANRVLRQAWESFEAPATEET